MKPRDLLRFATAVLAFGLWGSAQAAETITLTEEGGAAPGSETAEPSEDASVHDSYMRVGGEMRGRFAEKLYVQRDFPSNETCVAAIRFFDLRERIGEGRKILKAKLVLDCTNASGPKPIEVGAYPFIQDWEVNRFSWAMRMHDGKVRAWNTAPAEFNLTPAATTADDANVYDIVERHNTTAIMALGTRPDSDNTSIAEMTPAEFDVTEVVKLWYDESLPNFGWALVAIHPGTYTRFMATNGEGNGPRLVVEVE